jgi:hypothetical protein
VRLISQPLIHFVIIGGLIYLAYFSFSSRAIDTETDMIITVTTGEIDWMTESWQKRWNRPPTTAEMKNVINEYIRETVFYREALAIGLDKDDQIIRRRLGQKLEFLFADLASMQEPTEEGLKTYFAENMDRYRASDLLTFTHVFIDPDVREDETLGDAESLKAKLITEGEPQQTDNNRGDPFMLQNYYPERTELEILKLFGSGFSETVFELEPGEWHGPVLSGYGVHLVYVHYHEEAETPELSLVRDRVKQDWADDLREKLNKQLYDKMRDRYKVVIEQGTIDQLAAAR